MAITTELKEALVACFNEAADGGMTPATRDTARDLEKSLTDIEVFDLCTELGLIDRDEMLAQLEAQTGQVMTTIPDKVKEQVVQMQSLSAVNLIDITFQQKRMVDDITSDLPDRLGKLTLK